jgi:hypothetical protein
MAAPWKSFVPGKRNPSSQQQRNNSKHQYEAIHSLIAIPAASLYDPPSHLKGSHLQLTPAERRNIFEVAYVTQGCTMINNRFVLLRCPTSRSQPLKSWKGRSQVHIAAICAGVLLVW